MKKTMVLYPGVAVSHFLPMMQLADELVDHGYAVTVALIDPAFKQHIAFPATVDRVVSSKPAIRFHRLPPVELPPATTTDDGDFLLLGYLDLVRRHNDCLHDFLCSMPPGDVHALVVDSLSVEALDVAERLNVPGFVFHPANLGAFAIFLQLPSIRAEGEPSFRELEDNPLDLPGLPPMPASHLFSELLEHPESKVYKAMMNVSHRNAQYSKGFLANTFESLEPRVVNALRGYHHGGPALPPFYCVGPLVEKAGERGERAERHQCLAWLDAQPERSVVFLCFGSTGAGNHSVEQLREIAVGLEKSSQRFLWVVRAPPVAIDDDHPENPFDPHAEPDVDALVPAGFLERTTGRGVVVKLWAPQVDVLHHRATGAFVTHCGWNSVLEGITAGVPMLCWPLHSEQKMNKVLMVEEMRVAVEMVGWQQGLVTAEEVEAKVRLVMESEEGSELRERVTGHKEGAATAWSDGGSSRSAFARKFKATMKKTMEDTSAVQQLSNINFAATVPAISVHWLPRVELPPAITTKDGDFSLLGYLDMVRRHNECLHDFVCSMPPGGAHALVVDPLSVEALDVAKRLNVPGYVFHPGNAGAFAIHLQLPSIRAEGHPSFRELGDTPLEFPGLPPMPASHLYDQLLEDPESEVYKVIMDLFRRDIQYSNGFLVNTFESLEARVVNALRNARRHGDPAALPPFYCVGPLVEKSGERRETAERHECLAWLDRQPERSVVFLCFGSVGAGNHSKEQLNEIAVGLEKSGHRFLWVVRAPIVVNDDPEKPYDPRADPDLDALLPAGFLERTSGQGTVVKQWAPQVDVLHHRATGAFVTHCGWNSVLEGITAGVPMLCWPLYSEQKMNKVLMVEEMGVAVEMVGWKQGLVTAEEVEAKVRLVEEGNQLRARVTARKEATAVAWTNGVQFTLGRVNVAHHGLPFNAARSLALYILHLLPFLRILFDRNNS
uniref:UDP-glycosyltransferases domain-containing protein n=1 Tax=Oryza punctata TaxID=4537 RepID=A0A0E0L4V6_ORYPU